MLRARAVAFWELIITKLHIRVLLLFVRCLCKRLGDYINHYMLCQSFIPLSHVQFLYLISCSCLLSCSSFSHFSASLIMSPFSDPVQSNFLSSLHLISCHPLPLSSSCQPSPVCRACQLALLVINMILSHQIIQAECKFSSSLFALFPCIKSLTIILTISPCRSPYSKPPLFILEAREARAHGLDAPPLGSNW